MNLGRQHEKLCRFEKSLLIEYGVVFSSFAKVFSRRKKKEYEVSQMGSPEYLRITHLQRGDLAANEVIKSIHCLPAHKKQESPVP